jgi:uncharacterized membrane protein YjjB (DUF3815 family)
MKKFLLITMCLFLVSTIYSQRFTQAEKQNLINSVIDSTNISVVAYAEREIRADSIFEVVPRLEQTFWQQNRIKRVFFLPLLEYFHSSKAYEFAKSIADTIDTDSLHFSKYETMMFMQELPNVLFKHNDCRYANQVIKETELSKTGMFTIPLLETMVEKCSQYSEQAKTLLITISKSKEYSSSDNYNALYSLDKLLGSGGIGIFKDALIASPSESGCQMAIDLLKKYKQANLDLFIRNNITSQPLGYIRFLYIEFLLENYFIPTNIKWIKDYIVTELDAKYNAYMRHGLWYENILKPPLDLQINSLLDTLGLYMQQCYNYGWLKDDNYYNQLNLQISAAKSYLNVADSINCAKIIKAYQSSIKSIYSDSSGNFPKYVSKDAYKFLFYYPQYILDRLPSPYLTVKLINSIGTKLIGGSLQYYDGSWKDAINNNNGTFSIDTKLKTISLKMTYAYGSQTKSNVIVGKDTVVFQTVNTQVKLQNSIGNPIDQGTVQYYSGAWRDFGSTTGGTVSKELLPGNYSFRMTYAFASNDKQQDIGVNSTVIFQTVNAQIQLKNSIGNFIDQGTVQYYSGAWRSLGNTTNGVASSELLPNNYSFRMTYAFASNDKQQDISVNSTVVFQTINAHVQLKNSLGNLIDQGTVQYYSGSWRSFGTTYNGVSSLELLPNNYSFRMTYAFASNDKQQDISTNSTVVFQTVNAQVQLKNSLGNFIDQGTVQYYSGAWRNLGTTTNGIASIELLSNTYSFRMTYGFISKDISQNIALNNVITYSTVLCTIKVNDSQNQPVNNADIKYYSGAWREIGLTSNGVITKELLPANLSFRVNYNTLQKDMTQDISLNNIVVFGL